VQLCNLKERGRSGEKKGGRNSWKEEKKEIQLVDLTVAQKEEKGRGKRA